MFTYKQRMFSIWFKTTTSLSKMMCSIQSTDSNPLWNLSLQMHVSRWAEPTTACNLRWWGHAQHLATWSTNLAGDVLKGDKGICVSRGSEYNNKPVVYKSLPSRYTWVIAFLSNNLPPLKASRSGVSLRLWHRFRLTFRVSLLLISLFSSISSCSLRAAENERLSARKY